jgi:Fe2+ or Zn2+ uptake regulation protein
LAWHQGAGPWSTPGGVGCFDQVVASFVGPHGRALVPRSLRAESVGHGRKRCAVCGWTAEAEFPRRWCRVEVVVREVRVPSGKNWRLTERDAELLKWVARWYGVTAEQVTREFTKSGLLPSRQVVYRRLRALTAMGLLESGQLAGRRAMVFWVTRAAMELTNAPGNASAPNIKEYHHDLSVVDLGQHIREVRPDDLLVTEREIRARDTPNQYENNEPTYSVTTGESERGRRYPDLVGVRPDGTVWAHELERTRKPRPRLVRNMLLYVNAEHISYAMYWAFPDLVKNVEMAAEEANSASVELGRGRKIAVRVWNAEERGDE